MALEIDAVFLLFGKTNQQTLADYEGEAVKGPITRRIFRSVNSGVGIDMKPCTLAHMHQSAVLQLWSLYFCSCQCKSHDISSTSPKINE